MSLAHSLAQVKLLLEFHFWRTSLLTISNSWSTQIHTGPAWKPLSSLLRALMSFFAHYQKFPQDITTVTYPKSQPRPIRLSIHRKQLDGPCGNQRSVFESFMSKFGLCLSSSKSPFFSPQTTSSSFFQKPLKENLFSLDSASTISKGFGLDSWNWLCFWQWLKLVC